MPCPFCGADAVRVASATRTTSADDGARLKYRERLSRCGRCSEEFFTHEEIRGVREHYGLSQAGLERMLGLGAKTVVRWERGTVRQSQAADLLLRIVAEDRRRAQKLASGAGVTLAEARGVHRKVLARR